MRQRMNRWMSIIAGQLLIGATKLATRIIRWEIHGEEHVHESIKQGRPIVFAGWHGDNFLTMFSYYAYFHTYFKAVIIVPDSSNGRIMEYFGTRANIEVIKVGAELGPSQWARATVSMIKQIRNGHCALLSPDGPSGPAYEVKPGIAVISQQTKAVIIPASAASSKGIRLQKRWDKHLIPLPFSRNVVYFGPPIDSHPAEGTIPTVEELQSQITVALNDGSQKAEALCRQE